MGVAGRIGVGEKQEEEEEKAKAKAEEKGKVERQTENQNKKTRNAAKHETLQNTKRATRNTQRESDPHEKQRPQRFPPDTCSSAATTG